MRLIQQSFPALAELKLASCNTYVNIVALADMRALRKLYLGDLKKCGGGRPASSELVPQLSSLALTHLWLESWEEPADALFKALHKTLQKAIGPPQSPAWILAKLEGLNVVYINEDDLVLADEQRHPDRARSVSCYFAATQVSWADVDVNYRRRVPSVTSKPK